MALPNYPELWQCIGMIVGAYGIGYGIAAFDPFRHWPIVLVGLIGKIAGPAGFAVAVLEGRFSSKFAWTIVTNDLIWWVPFGLILYSVYDASIGRRRTTSPDVQKMAMRARTNMGVTLDEMSRLSPIMLVFLRHAGCTFCREALSDLSRVQHDVDAAGVRIVLVHMSTEHEIRPVLEHYGLGNIDRVSDEKQSVYKAFGLGRGRLLQVLGPRVLLRGVKAGLLDGHGLGAIMGDAFQMPGVFVVFHGQILKSHIHQSAADRPDYLQLVAEYQYGTRAS
jgi:peroxiredoxin